MVRVEPWLPTAPPGAVEQAIRKIIQRWEDKWFAASSKTKVTGQAILSLRADSWLAFDAMFIGQMRGNWTGVGLNVCNEKGYPHNPRDHALLAMVGREALDDLLKALGNNAEPAKASYEEFAARKDLLGFRITRSGASWSLALAIGCSAQIGIRQRAARSDRSPLLGRFDDALTVETCDLKAFLGRSTLSSCEVAALGVGDVVVFDRKVMDPVPLEVSGRYPKKGSVRVVRQGDVLNLTMTSEISVEASESAPL